MNYFKNERIFNIDDFFRIFEDENGSCSSIKLHSDDQIKINFSFYENELLNKFKKVQNTIKNKKEEYNQMR